MSKKSWAQIMTILLVMGMFAFVDITSEKEILFPEIFVSCYFTSVIH